MSICVTIGEGQAHAEAAYTLATLLDLVGLPFEFGSTGSDTISSSCVWLFYGAADANAANSLAIPREDTASWSTFEPKQVMLDGVPVLYAGEPPSSLVYRQGGQVRLSFDLVRAAFWLLSREEEWGEENRDVFGRFDCSASWLVRQGLAGVPVVNLYAGLLARVLGDLAGNVGLPWLRKQPWPHGQRYAVVLSHDVDDAGRFSPRQGLRLATKAATQGSPRGVARGAYYALAGLGRTLSRQPDPYWNFDTVMGLEDEAGYRSTFFFVPQAESVRRDPPYEVDAPRMRDLLVRLRAGGWEVGVHGSFESYLDPELLASHREKLEQASGGPVHGVRQHYLRLQVPETLRAQAEAGFVYDGTVGYRGTVGFRAGAAFPYHPFDPDAGRQLALLELPLTVMDGPLFWQLELTHTEAAARTLTLLETAKSVEGLAVLLWHQRVWYEQRYPGWSQVYGRVIQHLSEEDLAWVATAYQIAGWWLAREAVHLVEVKATGRTHGWQYRAGRAVEDLVFTLRCPEAKRVAVVGAEATIRASEGEFRLDFEPLAAGQSFAIELGPEVEAS